MAYDLLESRATGNVASEARRSDFRAKNSTVEEFERDLMG